jgi:hypothetical protein
MLTHNRTVSSDWPLHSEYAELLDFKGDSAIGEKDASKRSGTRLYNCLCQVGPNCGFEGWKEGAEKSRAIIQRGCHGCLNGVDIAAAAPKPPTQGGGGGGGKQCRGGKQGGGGKQQAACVSVWRQIVRALGFEHIARVEVVTSHVGCRAQGWHIDGSHGLTVIFALADVDSKKGPTQLDFTFPYNHLDASKGKVKGGGVGAPPMVHAAMPAGSVLLFNCNVSHRGTANISTGDRPILVLDCSPPEAHVVNNQLPS